LASRQAANASARAGPFHVRLMKQEDVSAVSAIHSRQFPHSRSTSLGGPFVRKMYRWFLFNQPELSLVAEQDGRPIGFVIGALGTHEIKIILSTLPQIFLGFMLRPWIILRASTFREGGSYFKALARMLLFPRPDPPDTPAPVQGGIDSIAVDRPAQGRGIGRALVGAFEKAARTQGARLLGLTVTMDNLAAQHTYEVCGWEVRSRNPDLNSILYVKELKDH